MKEQLVRMSLRISEEEKEAINHFAKQNDLSMSQVVRKAIREFLENVSKE